MRLAEGKKDNLLPSTLCTDPLTTCYLQHFVDEAFRGPDALSLSAGPEPEGWARNGPPPAGLRGEVGPEYLCLWQPPSALRGGDWLLGWQLSGWLVQFWARYQQPARPQSSASCTSAGFVSGQGGLCPHLSCSLVWLPLGSVVT